VIPDAISCLDKLENLHIYNAPGSIPRAALEALSLPLSFLLKELEAYADQAAGT